MSAPDLQFSLKWLLRPDEVAQILNISRREVYRMIHGGCFCVVPIGRVLRVTSESVKLWIDRVMAVYAFENDFPVPPVPGGDCKIRENSADVEQSRKKRER